MVEALIDSQGEAPSVLWSADSQRLFCWIQQARFTTYTVYRLDAGAFVELTLPNYLVPAVRKFQGHHRHSRGMYAKTPFGEVTKLLSRHLPEQGSAATLTRDSRLPTV